MAKTLVELWKLAMNDLRAVEKIPNFTIDMAVWYNKSKCTGCMAGAVIHQQGLKFEGTYSLLGDNDNDWYAYLLAINHLRNGHVNVAYAILTNDYNRRVPDFKMPPYGNRTWWNRAEELLTYLEKHYENIDS